MLSKGIYNNTCTVAGMKLAEKKQEKEKSLSVANPKKLPIIYENSPYSWYNLLSSPEVLLSLLSVFGSAYLMIQHSSKLSYSRLISLCKDESDYSLRSRNHELLMEEPSSLPTDCVVSLVSWMSICFLHSACCRVVLKAQHKHDKLVLEESLQCNFNDTLRSESRLANEKILEKENASRTAKRLKPLAPHIKSSHIVGDDVLINFMTIMCLIYSFILIFFVLYGDVNQVRGFGFIIAFTILGFGIVAPKMFDDVLTLQHWAGVTQNVCSLCLTILCFFAVTSQK